MGGGGSPISSEDLDPSFWVKLFGYVTVTGISAAQGKAIQVVGGASAQGFVTGAFGLLFRRAAWTVAPIPIKVASLVMVGMNYVVKRPLGGLVYFGPEAMKRAIQWWGPETSAPLPEITSLPDAGALVVSPGTSVIDKVPESLSVTDTVKYILGASVVIGSVYTIYKIYQRRPEDDE
jgi:hypothetical protein